MVHTFAIALDSTTVWLEATLSPKVGFEVFLPPTIEAQTFRIPLFARNKQETVTDNVNCDEAQVLEGALLNHPLPAMRGLHSSL